MADTYTSAYEATYGSAAAAAEPTGGVVTVTVTTPSPTALARKEGKTDYDPATGSFYITADAPIVFGEGVPTDEEPTNDSTPATVTFTVSATAPVIIDPDPDPAIPTAIPVVTSITISATAPQVASPAPAPLPHPLILFLMRLLGRRRR